MNVVIYNSEQGELVIYNSEQGELETFKLDILDVDTFVDLIKTYEYMNDKNNVYIFKYTK